MSTDGFNWPGGTTAAVSFSFDDARRSQIELGMPILERVGVKATFYVCLPEIKASSKDWRDAAARGHEIGNHTVNHPCSGNYAWCRNHLEIFTLERIEHEMLEAQDVIAQTLGVTPVTFGYPCGNKFVGRGENTQSYVPLVSRHFLAGRGFRDETTANPQVCDLAQVPGVDADRHHFDVLRTWVDRALERRAWVCFVNHDISPTLPQAIRPDTLSAICEYVKSKTEVWVDTIAAVARHLAEQRAEAPAR